MSAYKLDDSDFGFFVTLLYIMMRKFTASRMEEVGAMIDKKLYQPHWDRKQKGILHFIKGIALCAGGGSKSKAVADEFIKAYKFSEDSLLFNVSSSQDSKSEPRLAVISGLEFTGAAKYPAEVRLAIGRESFKNFA